MDDEGEMNPYINTGEGVIGGGCKCVYMDVGVYVWGGGVVN